MSTVVVMQPAHRLLVVEDDRVINDAVTRRLAAAGFVVTSVHDGPSAVAAAERTRFDVVVLDIMLPGIDGYEVCHRIQENHPVPVLMLTARNDEDERIAGLAAGADDYLGKPFSPRELVARVEALLRRVDRAGQAFEAARRRDQGRRILDDLEIDPAARRVTLRGEPVRLTRTEFDLLHELVLTSGEVVSREHLLVRVCGWDPGAASDARGAAARTIDSHVRTLRRKVGADRIVTVHGVGYRLGVRA